MSLRSDFCLACSAKVNISEPAFYLTVMLHWTATQVDLSILQIPTVMSDSQSLYIALLVGMISSKNKCVFIRNLNDLTSQMIFDAWWPSMTVGSKCPKAGNSSGHPPWGQFYLPCGIEETGSSCIVCIVCHQVLRHSSEHGTSAMGKLLKAKAHITKLNQLRELEVSELACLKVDEIVLAILNRQGSHEIPIVSSQRKFTFDFRFYLYWLNWQRKRFKLAAKDFDTAEFHQNTSNCYLMLGFVSAHSTCNALSNLELRRSNNALQRELVQPFASTLRNISQREYTLILYAIKKQLPSRNKVSLALEGWTWTNKLAITSGIA